MKEFDKRIGSILREIRNEKGFSQDYVAELIGVSKMQVSYWETGKRAIYAERLKQYCRALGVTAQSVFDQMDEEEKNEEHSN